MDAHEGRPHAVSYPTLVIVWALLIALTWLTVGLSGMPMGSFGAAAPFLVASVKAFLVADYFMHLKYESGFFRWILLIVLGTVVILTAMVYEDVAYRFG